MATMKAFANFIKSGIVTTLHVVGEPASIGGNQFQASFDETDMDVTRHMYGDEDEMTTQAVLLKSAVTNAPRIGETLIRVEQRKTYVITSVQSDVESYEINLRAKDG